MAATPINGKTNSPELVHWFPQNLVFSIEDSSLQPIIVCSNVDPGLTLTWFKARLNLVTWAFLLEKMKTVDFSETIEACDLKVGRCRQIIEKSWYGRSRSFLTLAPGHLHMKIETCFSCFTRPFLTKFCMLAFRYNEMKINEHYAGHMTKMAANPIYGKNPSKIFFYGTGGPISTKLGL